MNWQLPTHLSLGVLWRPKRSSIQSLISVPVTVDKSNLTECPKSLLQKTFFKNFLNTLYPRICLIELSNNFLNTLYSRIFEYILITLFVFLIPEFFVFEFYKFISWLKSYLLFLEKWFWRELFWERIFEPVTFDIAVFKTNFERFCGCPKLKFFLSRFQEWFLSFTGSFRIECTKTFWVMVSE